MFPLFLKFLTIRTTRCFDFLFRHGGEGGSIHAHFSLPQRPQVLYRLSTGTTKILCIIQLVDLAAACRSSVYRSSTKQPPINRAYRDLEPVISYFVIEIGQNRYIPRSRQAYLEFAVWERPNLHDDPAHVSFV